jgi:hypothetical protein
VGEWLRCEVDERTLDKPGRLADPQRQPDERMGGVGGEHRRTAVIRIAGVWHRLEVMDTPPVKDCLGVTPFDVGNGFFRLTRLSERVGRCDDLADRESPALARVEGQP